MKTVIKDKEKFLENLQMPKIDKSDKYCKGNMPNGCPYYDKYLQYFNDICILFDEELKYSKVENKYLRCQKCLECFEVEDEN